MWLGIDKFIDDIKPKKREPYKLFSIKDFKIEKAVLSDESKYSLTPFARKEAKNISKKIGLKLGYVQGLNIIINSNPELLLYGKKIILGDSFGFIPNIDLILIDAGGYAITMVKDSLVLPDFTDEVLNQVLIRYAGLPDLIKES